MTSSGIIKAAAPQGKAGSRGMIDSRPDGLEPGYPRRFAFNLNPRFTTPENEEKK
jgi:hypothetical protein